METLRELGQGSACLEGPWQSLNPDSSSFALLSCQASAAVRLEAEYLPGLELDEVLGLHTVEAKRLGGLGGGTIGQAGGRAGRLGERLNVGRGRIGSGP